MVEYFHNNPIHVDESFKPQGWLTGPTGIAVEQQQQQWQQKVECVTNEEVNFPFLYFLHIIMANSFYFKS